MLDDDQGVAANNKAGGALGQWKDEDSQFEAVLPWMIAWDYLLVCQHVCTPCFRFDSLVSTLSQTHVIFL